LILLDQESERRQRLRLWRAAEGGAADLGAYRNDPVGFCREVLQAEPWERQREIALAVAEHKRVAVRSCHHSGKTWNAAALAHWFLRCFDPSLVITTAPTMRQVKELLWYEIAQHQRRAGLPGALNAMDLVVSASQRAIGLTTNEPERFQGWHCESILVIVDEASGVAEPIYEAIEGILTGPNAHLLLIGNPNNPSGTFHQAFTSPLYTKFKISAADVPESLLPPGWRAERLQEWGEESPAYQVRVLGEFPPQGSDSLVSLAWVEEAQKREPAPSGPVEIGVDIAYYGEDESVAYVRQGPAILGAAYWRGNDTQQSAGRVSALAAEYGATIMKVDSIGYGAGTYDRLVEEHGENRLMSIQGVNVGEAALDKEQFFNRRSELYWGLAERFKQGDISIPADDQLLLDQLTQLKFGYTPRGQIKLESKDDLRKRRPSSSRWQSPDRADALCLAYSVCGNRWLPWSGLGETRDF
jgi:phage terminase large subunit